MGTESAVIVSNRGPITFRRDEHGGLVARRGGGGLVSGIGPLVAGTGATWIAAAMTDGDRAMAGEGVVEAEGFRVRSLAVDPDQYRMAYDVVCNATLWFLYHGLWDRPRRPRFDRHFREAWEAYRRFNRAFADAVADVAPDGAPVLVQDYHLTLVGRYLAERRPDLAAVHFSHTPFCTPEELAVLPDDLAAELLEGMAAHRACGFHTRRWADRYQACAAEVLGRTPEAFVSPLASDPGDLRGVAASDACASALADLDAQIGDRALVLRVDRIELSKNILRGFFAFDDLLTHHPEWRERVVFGAFVYPSREGLAEYQAYRQEVEGYVRTLNEKWATPGWTPVVYDPSDDFPRSVAALRRYDVLLVNPVRDGLNLVAKEGALLNERDGVLALSPEAGVWAELGELALRVHPYDISGTADVLDAALRMTAAERASHAGALREVSLARTPADWLREQLAAAG